MVEGQVRRLDSPRQDPDIPSLVFAVVSSERNCEARTSVPPTPPVCPLEPARLGRSSIHPRLRPARVTRSPTHAMPKTDCVEDYFFFRRFVFFFATAFFLFFAIAALLAMSGWRCKSSAVANRSALQPDYYSRKKLIETPLHFVYSRLLFRLDTTATASESGIAREKLSAARGLPLKSANGAESPMA